MKKRSRQIPFSDLRLLLARSGNQCAYPDCSHPIFNDENLFIAQLCHIEAVSPLGQRYNPSNSSKETNGYENLLFLCYRHHKETDNISTYSVQRLKKIKADHETSFKEASYKYPNEALNELIKETSSYWLQIENIHADHIVPDLAVPIDINSNIIYLIESIKENLSHLSEVNSVLMDECKFTLFEYVCLVMPNLITKISVALDQIEIKYIEELVLKNPENNELKTKLNQLRASFQETAQFSGFTD